MGKKAFLLFTIVGLISVLIYKFELYSIKISDIIINDAFCVNKSQVEDTLGLGKLNILSISFGLPKNSLLAKYPCVEDVRIERSFPRSIKIHVIGRKPFLKLANYQVVKGLDLSQIEASSSSTSALLNWDIEGVQQARFIADHVGIVFKEEDIQGLPLIFITEELKTGFKFDIKDYTALIQILDNLSKEYQGLEGKIVGNNLMIKTPQKMVFSLNRDVNRQLASLQLILQKAKINGESMELIDLRFDKPIVVYNPKK